MLWKKKEKVPDEKIAKDFFEHPITKELLTFIEKFTDDELTAYKDGVLPPALKLLKSVIVKAQFGQYSEEDATKLFCTPEADRLRKRLMRLMGDE